MSKIAFQGRPGAYSDLACRQAFPKIETVPCPSFDDVFRAVREGRADMGMIPVDNSSAGRVADVHHLLPAGGLHIVGEHFMPIHHCLLGIRGAKLEDLTHVRSHIHALPQCRSIIEKLGLEQVVFGDTARSAEEIARLGDKTQAAIASELSAEIYGLEVLKKNIEDAENNTTRFLVLAREAKIPPHKNGEKHITTLVFEVRSIPAALYKCLGGFATNRVNMTKLESYMTGDGFRGAEFYCDVEGHPEDAALRLALEELSFFARDVRILGVYPAHSFRQS